MNLHGCYYSISVALVLLIIASGCSFQSSGKTPTIQPTAIRATIEPTQPTSPLQTPAGKNISLFRQKMDTSLIQLIVPSTIPESTSLAAIRVSMQDKGLLVAAEEATSRFNLTSGDRPVGDQVQTTIQLKTYSLTSVIDPYVNTGYKPR